MKQTFKYRIFPTNAQRTILNDTLENCRIVYNDTLALRKKSWENDKKSISLYDTNKLLTTWKAEKPELINVYSQVLQNVQERVDLAFQAFFRRIKLGENPGYPRFKGFGQYDSFTFKQSGFSIISDNKRLRLSKIGDVKIKLHRPIEGKIKTLTIQRDRIGNWYACFSCEVESIILPLSTEMVGIDLGLSTFATFSNGEKVERQRWMKIDEKELKKVQSKISNLVKGSYDYRKAILKLNHIHIRIKNRRSNFIHQESRKLINRFGLIVFEDLNIEGMKTNRYKNINKGIADVAWGQYVKFSQYKAENAGRGFLKINPKGTTQNCSSCGVCVPKGLSDRIHKCSNCGLVIDRDENAARNILARGLTGIGIQSVEAQQL